MHCSFVVSLESGEAGVSDSRKLSNYDYGMHTCARKQWRTPEPTKKHGSKARALVVSRCQNVPVTVVVVNTNPVSIDRGNRDPCHNCVQLEYILRWGANQILYTSSGCTTTCRIQRTSARIEDSYARKASSIRFYFCSIWSRGVLYSHEWARVFTR